MSIKNLYATGKKGQNLYCDNLTVYEDTNINNNLAIAGDLEITGDLVVDNSVTSNSVNIFGNSSTIDSVSSMLVQEGSHNWSGNNPGDNPLSINLLNGNNQKYYTLHLDFYCSGVVYNSNWLRLRFNNDSNLMYGYTIKRIISGSAGSSVFGEPSIKFLFSELNITTWHGYCKLDFSLNQSATPNIHGFWNFTLQQGNISNPDPYLNSFTYVTGGNNITSLQIDVDDNNYTQWFVFYRLIRHR